MVRYDAYASIGADDQRGLWVAVHTSTMAKFTSFFFFFVQLYWFLHLLPGSNADYNVVSFGAIADGRTDSAAAFRKAWGAACSSEGPAAVYVPYGRFLVSQAIFNGPCRSAGINFRIDGTVIAPSDYNSYGASGEWIGFHNVEGVSVVGGRLDGSGRALWDCKLGGGTCPDGASSLTFINSKKIEIRGLRSINSKLFHIVILGCDGVSVRDVSIAAAGNSPNTDGIHVQRSTGVNIVTATIRTGDDCVSVGPGTADLWIERVFCGPGHGISIGSLGKKQQGTDAGQEDGVRNVTVKTATFSGTQNGVRIKTWGTNVGGYVSGVTFEDAVMRDVQNPIIIDQNYCPGKKDCPGQSSHIKISGVKYANIRGTSATQVAVNLECSPSNPCSGISLQDINLSYGDGGASSSCNYALGFASGLLVPPSCL